MPKKPTNLFDKVLSRVGLERRSSLENPQVPLSYPAEWLLDIYNGGRTDSGIRVSELTALQVSTVVACVNIIANGIASLPLHVMEKIIKNDRVAKRVAHSHGLFDLLHTEPNPEMTSATWRRTMQCHLLLWGNGYSEIQRDQSNRIIGIWPRNPARTRPVRLMTNISYEGDVLPRGTMLYETYETIGDSRISDTDSPDSNYGQRRLILAEDMLHFVGLSLDGRLGQDVVQLGRQAIGLSLATEKYGAKFFGNGAVPVGLLTAPGDMTEVQFEVFRRSWRESHGGENAQSTGVLPPGVTYAKTGSSPEEGQFLQVREYQRQEIAAIFGVPGHMIGDVEKSSGKSTVEQASIEFVLYCLGPHINNWEHELKRKLFPKVGQASGKFFAKFETRKLMYPDANSRTTFYSGGKNWGYLSTNDIREMEDMNPVDDASGDKYWMPQNMQDAATVAAGADQMQDHIAKGTLQAVPPNMKPVGKHPVAVAEAKKANDVAKARQQQAQAALAAKQPAQAAAEPAPAGKGAKKAAAKKTAKRAFAGIMRDAVGRAQFRKKADVRDYSAIFGPAVLGLAEHLEIEDDPTTFIKGYVEDVFKRSAEWTADALDAIAADELDKLVGQLVDHKFAEED